jgi:hypothetical protein
LSLFSTTKARAEMGSVILDENILACPVTSLISLENFSFSAEHDSAILKDVLNNNKSKISWKTKKNEDSVLITFKSGLVLRRIGISLKGEDKDKIQKIDYCWIPESGVWGNYYGQFLVKGDGNVHCYFLDVLARIPGNVPAKQIILKFPKGVSIDTLVLSDRPSDRGMETCLKPEFFLKINEAYKACLKNPEDKLKANRFVRLLKKTMYKYDCRRNYDFSPIPAWWLCGEGKDYQKVSSYDDPNKWFHLLSKLKIKEARELFGSELFRSTLDGEIAEMYFEDSKKLGKTLKNEKVR